MQHDIIPGTGSSESTIRMQAIFHGMTRRETQIELRGTQYHGHAIEKMKKHQAHNSEGHITYYRTPIASEKTICQAWHQQQAEQRMHLRGVEASFIMAKVHMQTVKENMK